MNRFFTDLFQISNIALCLYVTPKHCKLHHRDRPTHGLVLQLSGRTRYLFASGEEMTVEAGDLFYLPRGSTYRLTRLEAGDCIAVNFSLLTEDAYPPFCLHTGGTPPYGSLFRDLLTAWSAHTPRDMNICHSKLYELLCDIQRDGTRQYADGKARKMAAWGADAMAARLGDPTLTVAELAAGAGVSPEYFRRVFGQVYGISPKQYLLTLRMEKAKVLLAAGTASVLETALACGYETESYFCREFKRLVGVTPTAYRA